MWGQRRRYNVDNLDSLAARLAEKLPAHLANLHPYVDTTLGLQKDMRERMKLMSAAEFEQVLHPIFQEDEMTLIVSGAVLGAIAGAVQQYLTVAGGSKAAPPPPPPSPRGAGTEGVPEDPDKDGGAPALAT